MTQILYQAGETVAPQVSMTVGFARSGLSRPKASMVVRFIEFWCQTNCINRWSIRETRDEIDVSFDDTRDAMFFRISEFDAYFRHGVITALPEPTH